MKSILNNVSDGVAQIMPVEAVSNDGIEEDKPKKFDGKWKRLSHSLQPVDEFVDEDYWAGKHKRWKNTKLEYQLANGNLQSSEIDISPPIVESQSSELQSRDSCMLQPLKSDGQIYGSDADQEVLDTPLNQTRWVSCHSSQSTGEQERPLKQERPFQVGEGISSLPSGFKESPDAIRDRSIFSSELESFDGHDEEHCKNLEFVSSFDQGRQRALDLAKPVANMQENLQRIDKKHKENQAIHDGKNVPFGKQGNIEGLFARVTEAETDGELDSLQERRQSVAAGILHSSEGNESNEKLQTSVGTDRLKSSEPYQMEAERNREEPFWGRQNSRGNSFVHASNTNNASQHRANWHKHRGTPTTLNRRYNPRHESNRGRFGYSQGRKSEERYRQGARGETPYSKHFDNRGHHFANKKHVDRKNLDEGYRNKINLPRYFNEREVSKLPAQSARSSTHDSKRWDQSPAQPAWVPTHVGRSWDQSQQDSWRFSNMKIPANASFGVPDSKFSSSQRGSTGWVRKNDEYGQGQGGDPLRFSWNQGLDQGSFCERSKSFPEITEQPNWNVHNSDSNFAVQAEAMGSWKRQQFDWASNGAGVSSQSHSGVSRQPYQNAEASSEPSWNMGSFSQPYREQHGGSRQAYNNTRAYQPYHKRRDQYRHGLPSGGFSRSRQSQEVRSL